MDGKHVLCLSGCTADKFECNDGYCLQRSKVCDYFDNCLDLFDEKNCSYPPREYSELFISSFSYRCVSLTYKTLYCSITICNH